MNPNVLTNLANAARAEWFWPVVGCMVIFMGFALVVSFKNPGLRAAVKEHALVLVLGAILIFGGVGILSGLFNAAGIPGMPAGPLS